MFLGTHFFHDILFGVSTAALLLQVLTRRNVAILADRVITSATADRDSLFRRLLLLVLRAIGMAIVNTQSKSNLQ